MRGVSTGFDDDLYFQVITSFCVLHLAWRRKGLVEFTIPFI
jgi:hypothetical protein